MKAKYTRLPVLDLYILPEEISYNYRDHRYTLQKIRIPTGKYKIIGIHHRRSTVVVWLRVYTAHGDVEIRLSVRKDQYIDNRHQNGTNHENDSDIR